MTIRTTSSSVRPDFRLHSAWTVGEAAVYAEVKPATIRKWMRRKMEGKKLFREGFCAGPLRIDAVNFKKYLSTGRACSD